MTTPPPRPALRRAADADVSPAAPRAASPSTAAPEQRPAPTAASHPDAEPATSGVKAARGKDSKDAKGSTKKSKQKKKRQKKGGAERGDSVAVSFTLSQRDLDRLDRRADELGHSRERTLTLLVQAWLDS